MHSRLPFKLIATSLLALLVLSSTRLLAESPDLDDPKIQKRVDDLVMPFIDAKRVEGMSIGLIGGGKAKTFHYGQTSTHGKMPTDQTLYEIGSASKVFTGVLLADAVVSNKVKLDQAAEDLLPDDATMPVSMARKSLFWRCRPIDLDCLGCPAT